MNTVPPDELPTDDPSTEHLQCIGSFKAFTQDGESSTIEIWTRFGAVHDRNRARVLPTQLVLRTSDGQALDWVDQGEYRLRQNPKITFSTDDPTAP